MSSKVSWPYLGLYAWAFLSSMYMSSFHPATVFCLVLAMIAFFMRGRVPFTRWVAGTASLAAALVAGGVWQNSTNAGHLLGVGVVALAVFLSLELILFTLLRPTEGSRVVPPFLSGALLVASSMSMQFQPVAVIASVTIILLAFVSREKVGLSPSPSYLAIPLLAMAVLGISLALTARWSETRLAYLLNMFAVIPASGVRFPTTSSLSALQKWGGSDTVVLRVYGDETPPYLVGRTFLEFDESSSWVWRPTKAELSSQQSVTVSDGQSLLYYPTSSTSSPTGTPVRVEFPDGGSGFSLFTPRYFAGLAIEVPQMHRYSDGMWQVLARDSFAGSYWIYPFEKGWDNPEPPLALSETERQKSLQLPQNLTPEIALQAEKVAGAYEDHEEKARRITTYFQTQFTYGYDYPFESPQTALEEFLQKRPPAHCEFFATAGALMLRAQGVPTRYINGFVVQERSFDDRYFVLRLKHAHAWVEVYLPEQGWVTFDPTPPGTLDDPNTRGPFFSAALEWASNQWRALLAWFRLSPGQMLASLRRMAANLTLTQWLGLLTTMLSLWGLRRWWLARRNRPRRAEKHAEFVAGRHQRLTPALESLQQAISPPEWRRRPAETTQQWLARLQQESSLEAELADRLRQALHSYQLARYGGRLDPPELARLEQELSHLRQAFEGNSLKAREARTH